MLESPATDPGRAAEEMRFDDVKEADIAAEARALCAAHCTWGQSDKGPCSECTADREHDWLQDAAATLATKRINSVLAQLQADLIAARKERDEATRLLRVLTEETVLAGYPCGDRERTLANVRALRSDLVALAKMYGEACWKMVQALACVQDLSANNVDLGVEAAQLRARPHEAEKGREGSGRDPDGSGSQASPEAPSDLRPEGFDPSRGSARSFLIKHRIRNEWFRYPSRGVTPLIADAYRYTFEGAKNARKKWANARNWRIVPAPEALGIEARRAETSGSACESPAPTGAMPDPLTPAPEATQEAGDGR